MGNELLNQEMETTSAMVDAQTAAAVQEIQASIIVAKRFPRDETAALAKMLRTCEILKFAEHATYAFPRGNQTVSDLNIRAAEAIKQAWGNITSGWKEIFRGDGFSECKAIAWDMETNVKKEMSYTVEHIRDRKESKGGSRKLTETRDIYEKVANEGSKRERSCILALVPVWFKEEVKALIAATIEKKDSTDPVEIRIAKMVQNFGKLGVTQEMIEKRLKHTVNACSPEELKELREINTSIRENDTTREDWFETEKSEDNKVLKTEGQKA